MDSIKSILKYLTEADSPKSKVNTKLKDKDTFNINFDPASDKPLSKPDSNREQPNVAPDKQDIKKGSAADTIRATANMNPTAQMRDMMSRMRDIEADSDDPGYPEPETDNLPTQHVTTDNLPEVASKALSAEGKIVPTFHQVARLPGNMSAAIRSIGRQLFKSMTHTPTDQIYMIGDLGGMGPNTDREVNAVANFVVKNGEKVTEGDIDFSNVMPGYSAEMKQYIAAGIRWLLVKDFAGNYIYVWPESDSKDPSPAAKSLSHDRLKLPHREELDEGLGRNLALSVALIAGVAGINKLEAMHLMKTDPQLSALAELRVKAESEGNTAKMRELDKRIQITLDHIIVTGDPVKDRYGNPVKPKY